MTQQYESLVLWNTLAVVIQPRSIEPSRPTLSKFNN